MKKIVSAVRLFGFACIALVAPGIGCGGRPVNADANAGSGGAGGQAGVGGTFTPTRKVDMLFVIDDSGSTRLMQDNLLRNFPLFVTRLSEPPGFPDARIAVVSTDLGAGDGSVPSCDAAGGKNGIFQYAARGVCASTGLDPGATYIADDGAARNYTGNLSDVFTCIGALGSSGCAFKHPLAAIARALGADGQPSPADNQGFLRDDAFLLVVVLTDEDDCSAPAGSGLFDTVTSTNLASPLGPLGLYRCNEFGHLCNGQKPPRLAPNGSADDRVTLDGCVSAEGAGMLTPVATIAAQLRALKPFPDQQIVVAAITGPTTPYTVGWRNPGVPDTGPWPGIEISCMAADGSVGLPAVRIAQWVQAFGANGLVMSVCDTSFAPALDRIAQLLNRSLGQ